MGVRHTEGRLPLRGSGSVLRDVQFVKLELFHKWCWENSLSFWEQRESDPHFFLTVMIL